MVDTTTRADWRDLLVTAIDACLAGDLSQTDDPTLDADLALLASVARKVDAASARIVAERIRRRPATGLDVTRQLKAGLQLSGAGARRLADTAAAIAAEPAPVQDALVSGAISAEHARILHTAGASLPEPVRAALVDDARRDDPDTFRRRVLHAVNRNDSDDGAARAARHHAARTASWRERDDGMHELRALLAPADATTVRGALQHVMDATWRAEHPDRARERVPRASHGTRLADALVLLARNANRPLRVDEPNDVGAASVGTIDDGHPTADGEGADCTGAAGNRTGRQPAMTTASSTPTAAATTTATRAGPAVVTGVRARGPDTGLWLPAANQPLVTVLIDHDSLAARLAADPVHCDTWGNDLSPETIRRLACDAAILPMVLGSNSVPLDIGRRQHDPTPAQRLAVIARDRHCRFPDCTMPPEWCEIHHIHHWARGGPTDLDNLMLACHEHHHRLHEGGWNAVGPAQHVRFTTPDGRPYTGR
jgi:hypothetical protein